MDVATPIRDTNVFSGSFHSKLRLFFEPSGRTAPSTWRAPCYRPLGALFVWVVFIRPCCMACAFSPGGRVVPPPPVVIVPFPQ